MNADFRISTQLSGPVTCRLTRSLALLLAVGFAAPVIAGPGHDGGHDHDEAPIVMAGPALPRFETHSDLFEAVGTVRDGVLFLTLDAYATNEPVPDARIELESDTYKAFGEFQSEQGNYRFKDGPFARPGTHPVTLTITTSADADLLAADLVVPQAPPASAAIGKSTPNGRLLWGAGGLAAAVALAFGLRKARRGRKGAPA